MVTFFISQPGNNSINAAYRPVVIRVLAMATDNSPKPPVVYCDIYFGGVFYKTLSKTQYDKLNAENTEWQFDIQDAAQEYVKKFLGNNGGAAIMDVPPVITKVLCKFRASGYDANGFILPEGLAPIQATSSTPAVPGTGSLSNDFFIINATLQHEDNQDLATHLNAYKTGLWNAAAYPLTHRPDGYKMSPVDSDYFPILLPLDTCVGELQINYTLKGIPVLKQKWVSISQPCNAVITNMSGTQIADTTDVSLGWAGIGDITGYLYRVDGGPWIPTSSSPVLLSGVALGDHSFDVAGLCACSQGATSSQAFTVVDPATYTCSSVLSGLTVTQSGQGEVTFNFSSTGPAITWARIIDGLRASHVNATTGTIDGFSLGTHTLEITPICPNGIAGTGQSVSFSVQTVPAITKVNESSAGPGSIRTQVFEIGQFVQPGNRYILSLYLHEIIVTAVTFDTPGNIATKLRDAINATSTATWNDHGAAPPVGTNGFPPVATATSNQLTVAFDWQHSFAYSAFIS